MARATATGRERVRDAVGRAAPAIEQGREDGERERRLPDATAAALREAGLFKLWTPREYGGDEVDLPLFMEAVEEVSRIDGAAGWTFANLAGGALLTAFLPEAGAGEVYRHGPNVTIGGSVVPNGRAVPVEGGYRLSGRWPLVSGCHHADWLACVALVLDGETPRTAPTGAPDLQVMFIPRGEAEILDTWYSLGLRGTGSTDVAVEEVLVPERRASALFGAPVRVAGPLYRIGVLPLFSMALACVLLGTARSGIEAFVTLAKAKTPTMSQTGLAARPTIHAEVARATAMVESARAYLYRVAEDLTAAVAATGAVPDELEASRRLACATAGAACPRAVAQVYALAGATPVYAGHPLERCLRDIHTASQHLAVSPVWWEKTGQFYFGQGLGMP
ncbi:MAG TPA: acyl-CoA dehydrogenase family protein [Dehalococcoidia bacterium]